MREVVRCAREFGFTRVSIARREKQIHTRSSKESANEKRETHPRARAREKSTRRRRRKAQNTLNARMHTHNGICGGKRQQQQRTLDLLPAPLTDVLQRLILQTREQFLCALGRFDV